MVGQLVDTLLLHRFYFSHLPFPQLESLFTELEAQGLMHATEDPQLWEFTNQMERDIVYGLMPGCQRRRLHIKLARVGAAGVLHVEDTRGKTPNQLQWQCSLYILEAFS